MNIAEVREKYPQYEDLSDEALAKALHSRFYSDIEFDDFSSRIGLAPQDIGFGEGLVKGFQRGVRQPLTGLAQAALEQFIPMRERQLQEMQRGLVEGEIPATVESITQFQTQFDQLNDLKSQLEESFESEKTLSAEFDAVTEQAPVSALIGQTAGQVVGLPIPSGGIAPTLTGKIGQGALTGAAFGAAQPRTEEGGVLDQAATGALIGLAAPVVFEKAIAPAAGVISQKIFNYPRMSKAQQKLLSELQENPRNPDLAKFAIVKGKPKATAELKEAIKQFGSPEAIAVIKASSPTDKRAFREMVNIVSKGKKDPLFADKNRVGDIIGDSLKRRVLGIKTLLETSGKQIDRVARTQLKGKPVDISNAKSSFQEALQKLRVDYNPGAGSVDFAGSALEGAGGAQARDLVKRMALRLKGGSIEAQDVHFAKRLIDQKTAFGSSDRGLSGEIDRAIKGLRSNLNQALRDKFPAYAKANQKYSDSIDALNAFQEAAGSKINLDNPQALGVKARSFTNNTMARARLTESLEQMQNVLAKNGIRFKDDINTQVFVANALEERFKTSGSTTFQSEITKAGRDVITKGVRETVIDRAADVAEKIKGVDDQSALEALIKILGD